MRYARESLKMIKLVFGVVSLSFCLSAAAESASIDDAGVAAVEFLALVDEREYGKSYSTASSVLREEVSQEDWVDHVTNLRDALGVLSKRTVTSPEFHESLPEAPPGEYVIFTYDSSFENNKFVSEVVAVVKGGDGIWRVVGYYLG